MTRCPVTVIVAFARRPRRRPAAQERAKRLPMTDSEVTRETLPLRRRFLDADTGAAAAAASVPSSGHDARGQKSVERGP
jgi:hypothetical protein